MTYNPQQQLPPQPPYGTPPYGPPQPLAGPVMPPAEIKWSGLSVGGAFKIPVLAFIGRLTDMVQDPQSQFGLRIVERYDQVQILNSPVPWPWATLDLSIKYSDKEESAWGRHVSSAKSLGLAQSIATLNEAKVELVGKVYELCQKDETYGEDKTGQTMHGDVWRFVRVVQPGAAQPFAQPQYATPQVAPAAPVVPLQPQPAVAPVAPAVVPITPAPVAQPAGTFNTAPDPADTAAVRAKKLLHNRTLNEWLGVALMDDKIKADPAFINSVYDQSFIVGLKGAGQVTQNAEGKFQVIA